MGKRSAFFLAIFLIASVSQVSFPAASGQLLGPGEGGCSSGIYSPVDGSCVNSDQSTQQMNGLGTSGMAAGSTSAYGTAAGASTAGLPPNVAQQYPGLQSAGINGRVPSFFDQSGLFTGQGQLQAYLEQQALAAQSTPTPATEFQQMVRASLGTRLPVYGDSLFRRVPSTFAPLGEANVTPAYLLGPGDQLIIRIWGQVNFNALVTVDRSGSIYLPHVGEIHVAGLPYSQVQQHIRDAVGQNYKNFDLDVEMGQLRSIEVFVVGQARRPGTYTLSALSTLVTALFATGGPSVQGSLRDIQLKRNGNTISHFDLYDLLIFGDMSKDTALLSGDVIYIPPVGPQVAIGGSVRNPAIYELKGPTTVTQGLQFAGGISATASTSRASLERVDAHKDRTTLDVALSAGGGGTELRDGDILRILPISPKFQDTVTLRGNVAEPGRFAWHSGMKLSDILPDSQSLVTRDYWERRNQSGIPGPAFKPEYAVNPDFFARTPSESTSTSSGPNGQMASGFPNGQMANGLPNGNTAAGQLLSQGSGRSESDNALNCDPTQNSPESVSGSAADLASGSQKLPPCATPSSTALATGEETSRGTLPRPPLTVALPVPEIDWSYAVIERMDPTMLTTSLVPFNLGRLVLDHDASQDLTLQSGDVVTIFSQGDIKVPQSQRTKFVRLEGEFVHAGVYSANPGETLRQLVIRAGGLTPEAYLYGSSFTRESTRTIQQMRLNDYVQTLQLDIDRATIAASANGFGIDAAAASSARGMVARFQAVRATGRIVLSISPNATGIDALPDMPLEDGDTFTVPTKPPTVNVVGAVYNQNSFLYQRNRTVEGYLRLAGGPTQSAAKKEAFVVRADGSVMSRRSQSGAFGNTFASVHLDPGDTVVIPEKVPKPSALRNIQAYAQLFSSLAFGAAAIGVLQ